MRGGNVTTKPERKVPLWPWLVLGALMLTFVGVLAVLALGATVAWSTARRAEAAAEARADLAQRQAAEQAALAAARGRAAVRERELAVQRAREEQEQQMQAQPPQTESERAAAEAERLLIQALDPNSQDPSTPPPLTGS